jgi:hypothetical protein
VAGLDQVARHGQPHCTESNEPDPHRVSPSSGV